MSTDYTRKNYENEDRWHSYFLQLRSVMEWKPENVLEIGKGSGLVSTVLKSRGYSITSLDIDPDTKPDVVGSVLKIPFEDGAFDIVLCAEVLEHLPYDNFQNALAEIRRVARRGAVISLPHWGWQFSLRFKLPFLPEVDLLWKLSGLKDHPPGGEHFWEIGKRGYPLKRIRNDIESSGFIIRKTFMSSGASYHRFFILDVA